MKSPICMRREEGSSTGRKTSMSADDERLAELERTLDGLFRKRDSLREQADKFKGQRDVLNEEVRSLREQATSERGLRDELNQKVAEIKARIDGLREKLDDKRGELNQLDGRREERRSGLPPRWRVEQDLQQVEWEMATTPTMEIRDKEEELMERASSLRTLLEEHKRLEAQEDVRLDSLAGSRAIGLGIRKERDEIQAIRDVSQGHHERMLALYRKVDEEGGRADEFHARFVERLEESRKVNAEIDVVLPEVRKLRKKLQVVGQRLSARRDQGLRAMREELLAEAKRKLEAGEKLSLDEMKLIYGED
ncbi:hypothetical protein H8D40_07860 [Candidatus Bathyarchaeota archaeon]|nr:hypothetical protein [Candidatus Bathyarchaeota archaeon]